MSPNIFLKKNLKYALGFFTIGGVVNIVTFYLLQDFKKSTGIG